MYPIELKITNNEPEEIRVIMNAKVMAADAQGISHIIDFVLNFNFSTNKFLAYDSF